MAAYIALKACRFGSTDYPQGSVIPDGAVLPKRVRALARLGIIAPATETDPAPAQEQQEADGGKFNDTMTSAETDAIANSGEAEGGETADSSAAEDNAKAGSSKTEDSGKKQEETKTKKTASKASKQVN